VVNEENPEHAAPRGPVDATRVPRFAGIHQSEAVLFGVVARRFDQALATTSLRAPHTGERRVQGDFDCILQVQVGSGQQPQQPGQILRHLVDQRWIRHQVSDGWRHGRCRGR